MGGRLSSPVLVGRAAEVRALADALADARQGSGRVVLVGGEAGIGKTRLIEQAGADAARARMTVVRGNCLDLSATVMPFAPFAEIAGSLLENRATSSEPAPGDVALAALAYAPDARATRGPGTSADVGQSRLFTGARDALRAVSRSTPLMVIVEDVHWADTSTLDLLRFLAHALSSDPVALVVTYRTDESSPNVHLPAVLADLDRLPGTSHVRLEALTATEVALQVAAIRTAPPSPSLTEMVIERSEGNPFFVEELLAGGDAASTSAIPPSLRGILAQRLAAVPVAALSVVRAASALGRVVRYDLLASVTGISPAGLTDALRAATDHHVLLPMPDARPTYAFRHALLREVAYDDLTPSERAGLHQATARAIHADPHLATSGRASADAEIAFHAWRAADLPLALDASVGAARTAMGTFAFAEALGQYERALECWSAVPDAADVAGASLLEVLTEAARAAASARQPERAALLSRRALASMPSDGDPLVRAGILAELYWYEWEHADLAGTEAAAVEAESLVPDDPPSALRSTVLANLSTQRWRESRGPEARRLAEAAVRIAREAGARSTEGRALAVLAQSLTTLGRTEEANQAFEAADAIFRDAGDVEAGARSAIWWAWNEEVAGRFGHCVAIVDQALRVSALEGVDARFEPGLRSVAIECHIERGDWDVAEGLATAVADAIPDEPGSHWANTSMGRLAVYQGRSEEATRRFAAAAAVPATATDRVFQLEDLVLAAHAAGRHDEARRLTDEAISLFPDPTRDAAIWWLLVTAMSGEADRAEASRSRRDHEDAAESVRIGEGRGALLRTAAEQARRDGETGPLLEAQLATVRAESGRIRGASDPDLWAHAASLRSEIHQPREAVRARLHEAAALLADRKDRPRATAVLIEAYRVATQLGALPLVEAARSLALRASIDLDAPRDAPVGRGPGPTGTTEAGIRVTLTPREAEVLTLLVAGQSNREIADSLFISEKTASVHVSHLMDKLGARSRFDAARIAVRAGMTEEA